MPTLRQLNISTYACWVNMRTRCKNPNYKDYASYGGRGISVCAEWDVGDGDQSGFECFIRDMGPKPTSMTLDRRDNDGGYSPENCRWSTRKQQARNRRSDVTATVHGKTQCAQDWADELKVSRNAFYTRARRDGCEAAVRYYMRHGVRKVRGKNT